MAQAMDPDANLAGHDRRNFMGGAALALAATRLGLSAPKAFAKAIVDVEGFVA